MAKRRLQTHLEVETEAGAVVGGSRIRLLEAIEKYGSISQAARRIPMSYKAAWDALDDLNNLADVPVVERSIGGAGGGGSRLTDYGRRLVAMYRAVEAEYQAAMDRLHGEGADTEAADKAAFQRLLRRLALRTSARNQFACSVARIETGPVSALVFLALAPGCELVAQITAESAKELGLSPGCEVVALVKAPAVFLLGDRDARTSVGNHLTGVVSRVHRGPVSTEIVVDLPVARARHLTAVISTHAHDELGLKVGTTVTAAFQASSVIIATLG